MANAFLRYEYNEIQMDYCEDCQCYHAAGQHSAVFPIESGVPIDGGSDLEAEQSTIRESESGV